MLGYVAPFVHTAEARSFRTAAARLGVTPAAVSKAVARLEAELGVRLLNRTSRHVSLTAEGAVFLKHCRAALDEIQTGCDHVSQAQVVPQGAVRLSMAVALGHVVVAQLARLTARHPRLSFELSFTDHYVNLVEEEVDVAVRIGELDDSSLVARRLGRPRWVTVAAPSYLARHGTPSHPDDLARHACLKFSRPMGGVTEWKFRDRKGTPFTAKTPDTLRMDQGDLLVEAAVAGLGIAQGFDLMVAEPLARGALVEVLPGWAAPGPPIHALCVSGRQRTPKVRVVLDFLAEVLGGASGPHVGSAWVAGASPTA